MSEVAHSNTSAKWLAFFFVCFSIAIFGIGLWALFFYDVKEAQKSPAEQAGGGGGHSMRLPLESDYSKTVA